MKNIYLVVFLLLLIMAGCNTPIRDKNIKNVGEKEESPQKLIEQAFLDKYPIWDLDETVVEIEEIKGNYATGLVTDKEGMGGAIWLAYRDSGVWMIVWDGNGDVFCDEIDQYNFPVEMVPECWDDVNKTMIDRFVDNEESTKTVEDDESLLREAMVNYLTDGKLEEFLVDQIENVFAKGSLMLEGGAGGWWMAVKEDGVWEIVAMGSDVVDCKLIDDYGFPTDMVTVCYDWNTDQSRIRVTISDIDKILTEVMNNIGYETGKIEDTVFEWEGYSELTRIKARGTEVLEIVSWSEVGEILRDKYYFDDSNTSTNLYGFFVRDNVVCQMYQYNDGGIYLSCGVI